MSLQMPLHIPVGPAQVESLHGQGSSLDLPTLPTKLPHNSKPSVEPPRKKRKRENVEQSKVLNEKFQQTAFPSTEERIELANQLGMSARSVQTWCVFTLVYPLCFPSCSLDSKLNPLCHILYITFPGRFQNRRHAMRLAARQTEAKPDGRGDRHPPQAQHINETFPLVSGTGLVTQPIPEPHTLSPPSPRLFTSLMPSLHPKSTLPPSNSLMGPSTSHCSSQTFVSLTPSSISAMLSNESTLILDIRPYRAYLRARIWGALWLSVPLPPNLSLSDLRNTQSTAKARSQFSEWQHTSQILVYDADSTILTPPLLEVMRAFRKEGYGEKRNIFWLWGGFQAVHRENPELIDHEDSWSEPVENEAASSSYAGSTSVHLGKRPAPAYPRYGEHGEHQV